MLKFPQTTTIDGFTIVGSNGVVKAADRIESNISLLAFYRCVDLSISKYNLVNGMIDEYYDQAGINSLVSSGYDFSSGSVQPSQDAYGIDTYTKLALQNNKTANTATAPVGANRAGRFDGGNHSWLSLASNSDWNLGSADFTLETFIMFTGFTGDEASSIIGRYDGIYCWWLGYNTTGGLDKLSFFWTTNGSDFANYGVLWTPNLNTWYHVACVRYGSALKFFVDGTQVGADGSLSGVTIYNGASTLLIGSYDSNGTGGNFIGYMKELRVSTGIARYTTTFSRPTAQFATDSYTKLLLHFDDAPGTSFLDSETTPKTVTANYTARVVSLSNYNLGVLGSDRAITLNGSNSYMLVPISSDMTIGTGDFTIEFWVNQNSISGTRYAMFNGNDGSYYGWGIEISLSGDGKVYFYTGNGTSWGVAQGFGETSKTLAIGNWYHIAVVRSVNTLSIYVDGVLTTGYSTSISNFSTSSRKTTIGCEDGYSFVDGYMREIRLSKVARYTANFTPQTTPFVSDANTYLLIHGAEQVCTPANIYDSSVSPKNITTGGTIYSREMTDYRDRNFVDSEITAKVVTNVGTVRQLYGKFNQWAMFFDGSTAGLTVANSTDFSLALNESVTYEAWVMWNAAPFGDAIIMHGNTVTGMRAGGDGNFKCYLNSSNIMNYALSNFTTYRWYHIAMVRNSTAWNLYVNGVSVASATDGSAYTHSTLTGIGWDPNASSDYHSGWIKDVRISKGIARYTGLFNPPQNRLVSDSNTKLLIHGDFGTAEGNSFFSDSSSATAPKAIKTYGGARICPDTSIVNTGAGYFDGNYTVLTLADSDDWNFGAGNFTIDYWINFRIFATGVAKTIIGQWVDSTHYWLIQGAADDGGFQFYWRDGATVQANYSFSMVPSAGSWYHFAFVRSGTDFYVFVNGVSQTLTVGTAIGSTTLTDFASVLYIGMRGDGTRYINAYLNELRISKGIARWTSGFTVPTAAYTTDSYTKLLVHFDMPPAASVVAPAILFDGSGDYIQYANSTDWDLGTAGAGDFTIECWAKFLDVSTYRNLFSAYNGSSGWQIYYYSGALHAYRAGGDTSASWTPITHVWYHIAVVRVGSSVMMYVNGKLIGSPADGNFTSASSGLVVGASSTSSPTGFMSGWMKNARITKGLGRYSAEFVPPTYFTPDDKTVLLIRGDENSNNAEASSIGNDDNIDWVSNEAVGHSFVTQRACSVTGYVVGLMFKAGSPTGNLVVNLYATNPDGTPTGSSLGTSGTLDVSTLTSTPTDKGFTLATPINLSANTQYCMMIEKSGTVSWSSGTRPVMRYGIVGNVAPIPTCGGNLVKLVGTTYTKTTNTMPFNVKVAFYDSEITPKAGTVYGDAKIGHTEDYRNTVFFDSASSSPKFIGQAGKAKVDWVAPFGTGVGYFGGSGNYLEIPASSDFDLSGGVWTTDLWFKANVTSTDMGIITQETSSTAYIALYITSGNYWNIDIVSGGTLVVRKTGGTTLQPNTWYHLTVVEYGSDWYIYVNGVVDGYLSDTDRAANYSGVLRVGYKGRAAANEFNGFLDNVRVSKGIPRWIYAFNPPSMDYYYNSTRKSLTLQSISFPAVTTPNYERLTVYEEDVDSITLNTDLKAWVSRDNGVTFSQVTLAFQATYATGRSILAGVVDMQSNPTASSYNNIYKLTTHNGKNLKLHGAGLNWG